MRSCIELAGLKRVLILGAPKYLAKKQKIPFLNWADFKISEKTKAILISKRGFWQLIRIAQENAEIIRGGDCSV